jgi:hypothetical protein
MEFERNDRVRLRRELSGIPAGSEGVVIGRKSTESLYVVQFAGRGAHEIPEGELEEATDAG